VNAGFLLTHFFLGSAFFVCLCFALIAGYHRPQLPFLPFLSCCTEPFSHINYSASDKKFLFLIGFHATINGAVLRCRRCALLSSRSGSDSGPGSGQFPFVWQAAFMAHPGAPHSSLHWPFIAASRMPLDRHS